MTARVWIILAFCPLAFAQVAIILHNSDLSVNVVTTPTPATTIVGWSERNTTLLQGNPGEGVCANITDPVGSASCSQLYQLVNITIGVTYRFSCFGYGDNYTAADNWGNGLLVTDYVGDTCEPLEYYTAHAWFNASLGFVNVFVDFEATSATMALILHSDSTSWACYKNCSLVSMQAVATPGPSVASNSGTPTAFPTRLPSSAPSRSPSRAPSHSPNTNSPTQHPSTHVPSHAPTPIQPPCVDCGVPVCNGVTVVAEQTDCDTIRDFLQIGSWSKTLDQASESRALICSVIDWENKFECHHKLERELFQDVCITLRNNTFAGFLTSFNSKWCHHPKLNFSDLVSIQFGEPPAYLTSLEINYTEVTNQAPCLETQKYEHSNTDDSNSYYRELGPLADVVANPQKYPNFPPITKIKTSRTTEVLFNTACLETTAVAPSWYGLLGAFLVVSVASCILLFARRKLQPVRSRDPFLLWSSVLWIMFNFIWISIDQLTGNRTSCGLISFGNLVAFPMLLFTYLLRALRLFFLYKWAEGKMSQHEWFHQHRYLVSRKSFLLTLGVFSLVCLIIFIATNAVDGTFNETFISSGRCDWWDLNQQVINAATEAGVALLPTDFSPNGFVPYSVEYSSCIFCSTYSTQVVMCVLTVVLLCALVLTLILVRKINDQFKLWFELVGVMVALCIVAIVRSIMFFPSAATSMMTTVGSDLSALFLACALFPVLLASAVYPALLTFNARYRVAARSRLTAMDGEIAINGKAVSISLEEVLTDTFSLNLFKQFSVESFAVENVMYWIHFKEFERYQVSDPARGQAATQLYETFIRQGAVMEVNIEAPLRERYDSMFGVSSSPAYWAGANTLTGGASGVESGDALASTARQEGDKAIAPDDLSADAFQDVTKVITSLMLTNDWLRFKQSPLWAVLAEELQNRESSDPLASEGGTQMSELSSKSS